MKRILLIILVTSSFVFPNTHYAITRYLAKNSVKTISDTSNVFYVSFRDEILSEIQTSGLKWQYFKCQNEELVSRAYRINLIKDDDHLDSLPYAVWDLCMKQNIDTMIIFYIFNDDDEVVSHNVKSYLSYVIPILGVKRMRHELSDENINYYVSIYLVRKNECIFSFHDDIDDILEKTSDDTEYGAAKEFRKQAFKRIKKRY